MTDQSPALEAATISDRVKGRLNALHAVRKNFMKAQSSGKILRSLRSNIRTYVDVGFMTGESVYYRRQNCKRWHGLVKVLAKEGQCALIRSWKCIFQDISKSFDEVKQSLEVQGMKKIKFLQMR